MATWKFKPYTDDEPRENPTQSQFFTTTEVEGLASGLIREAIQNAIDEQLDLTKPVEIRITLSGSKTALSPQVYNKYFNGLIEHLQSPDSGIRELPDLANEHLNFLVFEDFNTKGLRGDPCESKDADINNEHIPHNFYYFWRNIGITGKPEDKLGRWGIGKTVFPASSKINTFFGYTVQEDTKATLLMGQSILRKHNLVNSHQDWGYRPYGYFGQFDNNSYFSKPINDSSFLREFKLKFQLTRTTQSGLSVVIPFVKDQLTKEKLLLACLKQYFFPILNKNLVVVIKTDDHEILVSNDTIFEIAAKHIDPDAANDEEKTDVNTDDLHSLFNFTKWIISLNDEDYFSLVPLKPENQPRWDQKLWQDLDLDILISHFDSKNKIAFKVPVKYHIKEPGSKPKTCWFKVFLERDEKLKKPEDHFIRENITIIDVKSLEVPGVRGIVLIEDKDLANLLGDSENPAHTQWQEDSQNFINKYIHGDKCILFIKRILQRIYSKLQKPATGLDKDILKDLFFLDSAEPNSSPTIPDDDSVKDDITDKPVVEIPPSVKKPIIRCKKIDGGIILYSNDKNFHLIESVSVKMAYMTTRGSALSKYQKFDFELNKSPIQIFPKDCTITECRENQIEFSIEKESFELTLKGFDTKRDLFIDITSQTSRND